MFEPSSTTMNTICKRFGGGSHGRRASRQAASVAQHQPNGRSRQQPAPHPHEIRGIHAATAPVPWPVSSVCVALDHGFLVPFWRQSKGSRRARVDHHRPPRPHAATKRSRSRLNHQHWLYPRVANRQTAETQSSNSSTDSVSAPAPSHTSSASHSRWW